MLFRIKIQKTKDSECRPAIITSLKMIKTFVLVMLVAACSANYNVSSTCSPEEVAHSYLDVAMDMISKARYYIPTRKNSTKAADCADLLHMGYGESGVYEIWPMNRLFEGKSIYVYCDMDTDGGGWTVIQRRGDFNTPNDYFYRDWQNYKEGFGNIKQDFWLGNDKIFALTNYKLYSVRFDLMDFQHDTRYAVYDKFWIDGEHCNYTLHISLYTGDAGESMIHHNKLKFITFDKDNERNCAKLHKGGWWYAMPHCHKANLNGLYYKGKTGNKKYDGASWLAWKNDGESLEWIEIKIRPKHFKPTFS